MMSNESQALTLWIPELLSKGRVQESDQFFQQSFPALQTLLSKAQKLPLPQKVSGEAAFYRMASYLAHQADMLPIAVTQAMAEVPEFESHKADFWVKVDPVQMVPDRDTLLMMPQSGLNISVEEAQSLIRAFNAHFAQENIELIYGSPYSWYLSVVQSVDLKTCPLSDATMRPLMGCNPQGHAASYWLKLMNETQMLFYTHPVNEARREAGRPEINGVWIWGEGVLSFEQLKTKPEMKICTQQGELALVAQTENYLQGLAKAIDARFQSALPSLTQNVEKTDKHLEKSQNSQFRMAFLPEWEAGHQIWVLNELMAQLGHLTEEDWIEVLHYLESCYFQPLLERMQQGKLHSLLLVLGDDHLYHLEPKDLKRFWRWKRSLKKLF